MQEQDPYRDGSSFSGRAAHQPSRKDAVPARAGAAGKPSVEEVPPPRSDRDMRSKRPPRCRSCCAWTPCAAIVRVLSLLVLDLFGVSLAIFTALALKEALLSSVDAHSVYEGTRSILAFAYLLTALLFARSGLYAERSQRPGLSRIVGSLFQVAFVALVLRGRERRTLFKFYTSTARSASRCSTSPRCATSTSAPPARSCTRPAISAAPCSSAPASTSTTSPMRLPTRRTRRSRSSDSSRPSRCLPTGCAALARWTSYRREIASERFDEVIIADPEFPEERAVELVDQCHRRGVRVRIAPSTMEILIHRAEFVPGQSVPLFELGPPVFEGIDFALKRAFDVVGAIFLMILLSPLLPRSRLRSGSPRVGRCFYRSMRPGIGQLPFACLKFRTMYCDAHESQGALEELNEASGALFKIRTIPASHPWGASCGASLWTSYRRSSSAPRRDVAGRPTAAARARLRAAGGLASQALLGAPGMTGLWQVSGRSELDFDDLVRLDFNYLERWSLALDLAILLKTIPAVIMQRGAY